MARAFAQLSRYICACSRKKKLRNEMLLFLTKINYCSLVVTSLIILLIIINKIRKIKSLKKFFGSESASNSFKAEIGHMAALH